MKYFNLISGLCVFVCVSGSIVVAGCAPKTVKETPVAISSPALQSQVQSIDSDKFMSPEQKTAMKKLLTEKANGSVTSK